MRSIKTLEQYKDHLVKDLNIIVAGPDKLTDNEYLQLASQVAFIEYTDPWDISYPMVTKYRKQWGNKTWLSFLKKLEKGKFWPRLTEDQKLFLEKGEI